MDDSDGWYARIKKAGYRMQAEYVWSCASLGWSFLFYDQGGNMIQIWEHPAGEAVSWS